MCLHEITGDAIIEHDQPTKKWPVGYKVFLRYGSDKAPFYRTPVAGTGLRYRLHTSGTDATYPAQRILICSAVSGAYSTGFHCFKTLRSAQKYLRWLKRSQPREEKRRRLAVVKVRYAGLTVYGTQKVGTDWSIRRKYHGEFRPALSAALLRLEKEVGRDSSCA